MKRTPLYTVAGMLSLALFIPAVTPCAGHAAADRPATDCITASGKTCDDSSVLERFRTYSGPRTPDGLTALFTDRTPGKVRQQPQVALSDGATALILAIKAGVNEDSTPGFSLTGARQVSLKRLKNNEWIMKAIPDKGVRSASLLVSTDAGIVEYPLTVAPPLPPETDLSKEGFAAFLETGQDLSNAPAQDRNRGVKQHYVDDYIYTANFLARQLTTGTGLEARRQRALRRTLAAPDSVPHPVSPKKEYDGVFYGDL